MTKYSVFLSSPADLGKERKIVDDVCQEISGDQGRHGNFVVELVKWETHVRPGVGESAQDVINTQIGQDYDVYVGLLGARFGTETKEWGSGTEEEFEIAFQSYKKIKRPEVMFYFLDRIPGSGASDLEQFVRVRKFREKLQGLGVLYCVFQDEIEIRSRLHRDISSAIRAISQSNRPPPIDLGTYRSETQGPQGIGALKNWHHLSHSDPEAGADSLLRDAKDSMLKFTSETKALTDRVARFSAGMKKSAAQLHNRLNAPSADHFGQLASQLGKLDQLLQTYCGSLLMHIPSMHASIQDSITKVQRSINILLLLRPLTENETTPLHSSLSGLRNSIIEIGQAVTMLSEAVRLWPDNVTTLSLRKRQISALHLDLISFSETSAKLILDLMDQISNSVQRIA